MRVPFSGSASFRGFQIYATINRITMNCSMKIDMREEVLAYLAEQGFSREFLLRANGFVDLHAQRLYRPNEVHLHRIYRFAGEREDGAMDVLYTLITDSGVRGWILPGTDRQAAAQLKTHYAHTHGLYAHQAQAT